jgi:phosphoglycerate dehydrogenase-like enzyme
LKLTAWYPNPHDESVLDRLQEQLSLEVRLLRKPPYDASQILIEGRPTAETLDGLPKLKAVVIPFAGPPKPTVELLRERPHLSLHNLHHNSAETAEIAIALLLAAAKRVVPMDQSLRKGDWRPRYDPSQTILLEGKTALILGFGQIGQKIARSCLAMGMKVMATRRTSQRLEKINDVDVFPAEKFAELLPKADCLFIALPLTADTDAMVGAAELDLLPPKAILINIARAQIINEEALFQTLKSRKLHSAGLDVWYQYPPADAPQPGSASEVTQLFVAPKSAENSPVSRFPFDELDNVVMSPHRGGTAAESEIRRAEHLARLLNEAAETGELNNRVNLELGY